MWTWRIFGGAAFLLGAVGLIVPIWPTTVFWILAAMAFTRSNPAWRDWIYGRPGVGKHVEGFVERGVLSRSGKVAALGGMALAGAVSLALSWSQPLALGVVAFLLSAGALFVLTRRAG
ncbi:MAG: YbaN family protein [Pseudomonadota bacterium]